MENLIGAIVFLIVGIGFLYAGLHIWCSSKRIEAKGIKARAKIIGFKKEESTDSDGFTNVYHFPIIKFTDKYGIITTQKLDSSANPKRINQPIEIIYLKEGNKYEIIENNQFWKSYFPMIFIIMGILFSGISVVRLINLI